MCWILLKQLPVFVNAKSVAFPPVKKLVYRCLQWINLSAYSYDNNLILSAPCSLSPVLSVYVAFTIVFMRCFLAIQGQVGHNLGLDQRLGKILHHMGYLNLSWPIYHINSSQLSSWLMQVDTPGTTNPPHCSHLWVCGPWWCSYHGNSRLLYSPQREEYYVSILGTHLILVLTRFLSFHVALG